MSQWVTISKDNKVWIAGCRVHHGMVGVVITAVGVALVIHDRADYKRWFPDIIKDRYA